MKSSLENALSDDMNFRRKEKRRKDALSEAMGGTDEQHEDGYQVQKVARGRNEIRSHSVVSANPASIERQS
jgi:hypothetical protein